MNILDAWAKTRPQKYMTGGPCYPTLAGAKKWRRKAEKAGTVAAMVAEDRNAYGFAVLDGILSLQRASLGRELPLRKPQCASGTWHSDGDAILKAVRQQNRSRA